MMPTGEVWIPTYTYGTYRSQDGSSVTFTDDSMRALVKNTNAVIRAKAFTPTLGYDHPVAGNRNTDAHGHIKAAKYEDGVVSLLVKPIRDREGRLRLVEDARAGRRPHVSGEHVEKFSFVDGDKTVFVGPTIVGLAALGSERPAIKNPKIVPLSEIEFPDTVSVADRLLAKEELRKSGLVAQTFAEDGVYAFAEITLDPKIFDEQEQPMTPEELQKIQDMITGAVTKIDEKVDAKITKLQTDVKTDITAMSEASKETAKREAWVGDLLKEKPLGKLAGERLLAVAKDPTFENVRAFAEALPASLVPSGKAGKVTQLSEGETEVVDDSDEPEALAVLRMSHFKDVDKNDALLANGLKAFSEYRPKEYAAVKDKPLAEQIAALQAHVKRSLSAAN
jgi:hypothetical protein